MVRPCLSTSPPSRVAGSSIAVTRYPCDSTASRTPSCSARRSGAPDPAEHRDVAVHDHLVLDEDAVGAVVDARRLDDRPVAPLEHVDVLLPLAQGQPGVDGAGARDVRDDPVREPGRRSADESEATVHSLTLGARVTPPTYGQSARHPAYRGAGARGNGLDPDAT